MILRRHWMGLSTVCGKPIWDGPAILTACMGGVDRFQMDSNGKWSRLHILEGDPRERPLNGASEVRPGHGSGGQFLTTIEPWHGNQVAVYLSQENDTWNRTVIDDTLKDGHVLDVADFDGDGSQEIIAGMRGEPYGLYFYEQASDGWEKSSWMMVVFQQQDVTSRILMKMETWMLFVSELIQGNIRWYEKHIAFSATVANRFCRCRALPLSCRCEG